MYKILLTLWFIISFMPAQTIIGLGNTKLSLFNYLIENYKTNSTLGYDNARDVMYSIIDLQSDNTLKGIYSNYTITIDPSQDPSTNAFNQGINCEHTWPQSMGAGSEPQRSDLHHLYPARVNVNSSRQNYPFDEIDDNQTDKWWRLDYSRTSIPNQFINEYSEVKNGQTFEPREDVKGNIARSMFYFYTIYNNAADQNFFDQQKDVLFEWHKLDPVDEVELARTYAIANYQNDIPNPFVIDSTLIRRIWYLNCFENINSQVLLDNILSSEDYSNNYDINSDTNINIFDLIHILNRESGQNAYFICD